MVVGMSHSSRRCTHRSCARLLTSAQALPPLATNSPFPSFIPFHTRPLILHASLLPARLPPPHDFFHVFSLQRFKRLRTLFLPPILFSRISHPANTSKTVIVPPCHTKLSLSTLYSTSSRASPKPSLGLYLFPFPLPLTFALRLPSGSNELLLQTRPSLPQSNCPPTTNSLTTSEADPASSPSRAFPTGRALAIPSTRPGTSHFRAPMVLGEEERRGGRVWRREEVASGTGLGGTRRLRSLGRVMGMLMERRTGRRRTSKRMSGRYGKG